MRRVLKVLLPRRLRRAIRAAQTWTHFKAWGLRQLGTQLPSGVWIKIESPPEWLIFSHIFVHGEYDSSIRLVLHARNDPLVVDLGANVGYFLSRLVDQWINARGVDAPIRIVAIEGSPRVFRSLTARVQANPLLAERCDVHLGLVGRRTGVGRIQERPDHICNSLIDADSGATAVPFIDIDELLGSNTRVALLKCDIEGSEEMFLENYEALLSRTDAVVIEIHGNLCDAGHCAQLLREAGFAHRCTLSRWERQTVDLFTRVLIPGIGIQ